MLARDEHVSYSLPDIDLLEQICNSTTVRLAPNDAESATITFDTGAAQEWRNRTLVGTNRECVVKHVSQKKEYVQ